MSEELAKASAIRAVYRAVAAPTWAAPNLDALRDVLRDLSWLPAGPVQLATPDLTALSPADRDALLEVLRTAVAESTASDHPLHITA
jgi:hypothetical protein